MTKKRKLFIFNPINKIEPMSIDLSKTPYWKNINEIITNNGCTNEEYNLISCYLVKISGRMPLIIKTLECGQIKKKLLLDSFVDNSTKNGSLISYHIIKSCLACYLYKEYSVLFFESVSKPYCFFLKKEDLVTYNKYIYRDILEPIKLMNFLGFNDREIDLANYLLICKKKIFNFLTLEVPLYLEYFNIHMDFNLDDEYKKVNFLKLEFNIKGIENLPSFIKYLFGENPYQINYIIFNEFNYKFDFNQIINFSYFIYLINNYKGNKKENTLLNLCWNRERNTFNKFIEYDLPIYKLRNLVNLPKNKKHLVNKSIDYKDIDVNQSIYIIYKLLNKACLKGVFCIDESFIAKKILIKIKNVLN